MVAWWPLCCDHSDKSLRHGSAGHLAYHHTVALSKGDLSGTCFPVDADRAWRFVGASHQCKSPCFWPLYIALIFGSKKSKMQEFTWLIPLIWLSLFLSSNRNGPLFSVVSVIAMADLYPQTRWLNALSAKGVATFQLRDRSQGYLERNRHKWQS